MTKNDRLARPLFALLLASLSLPAAAMQPLLTDDTGTQGSGGNQIEFAYVGLRQTMSGDTDRLDYLPFTYTRGVSETVDLFVSAGYGRVRLSNADNHSSGAGTPSVGAKWRFFGTEENDTSLALKPEIFFPINGGGREADGFGTGKISGNLTFIVEQQVPFGSLLFNAALGRNRINGPFDGSDATVSSLSLAPIWEVSDEWKLALDLGVKFARSNGNTTNEKYALIGAIYSPDKDLDLAIGILHAADSENPRTTTQSATLGITWRFQ